MSDLTTRAVITRGSVCGQDGTLLPVRIDVLLVDADGKASDDWDRFSEERVLPIKKTVYTYANGLLPAEDAENALRLWPNTRGTKGTQYLFKVHADGVRDFKASLPAGDTPITWMELMASGTPLTPQELSAFELHAGNADIHLSQQDRDLLDALSVEGVYTHTQASASATWTINHNLGFRPEVAVTDAGGNERCGSVSHTSNNQTVIRFATALAGFARLT